MPIFEKITKYSVSVFRRGGFRNLPNSTRQIRLSLESGNPASIDFVDPLPSNFSSYLDPARPSS